MGNGWRHWRPMLPTAARASQFSSSARRRARSAWMPPVPVQRVGELKALTLGKGPADGPQKWLGRLRRQRALQRRLPRGHQRPPMGDHRQDEGARVAPAARRRRRQCRQPLPPDRQAVRLLASSAAVGALKKILAPAERHPAEVLFYTGCNVLRTPHIVLNVMDILDALELDSTSRRHRPLLRRHQFQEPTCRPTSAWAIAPSSASASRAPPRC